MGKNVNQWRDNKGHIILWHSQRKIQAIETEKCSQSYPKIVNAKIIKNGVKRTRKHILTPILIFFLVVVAIIIVVSIIPNVYDANTFSTVKFSLSSLLFISLLCLQSSCSSVLVLNVVGNGVRRASLIQLCLTGFHALSNFCQIRLKLCETIAVACAFPATFSTLSPLSSLTWRHLF